MEFLNKEDLVRGDIYAIKSRNLVTGVYDGDEGFIGVREKMGSRYLFTEYLARESGGVKIPFDTVHPESRIGTLPDSITAVERFEGSHCAECGKPAKWTGSRDPVTRKINPGPWKCESGCEDVHPRSNENKELLEHLESNYPEPENDRPIPPWRTHG